MNAGTVFGSISDTLTEAELFINGKLHRLASKELGLGYRISRLPPNSIVLRARLRFASSNPDRVARAMALVDDARKGQPKNKSAGCAFKNPPGKSAGQIIDKAGLKGLRVGDAMVSHQHGNFIVNLGSATQKDVLNLLDEMRSRVTTPLELEWRCWG
jgi:UDP-N-acetylmuramate dehydrogenase